MRNFFKITILLVIAFILGGAFIADKEGTSLWASLSDTPRQEAKTNDGGDTVNAALIAPGAPMEIADMVSKASPAVVNIKVKVQSAALPNNPLFSDPFFRQFFGDDFYYDRSPQYETGIGTGFLITNDGYILTNQHVIENAMSVEVQLNGKTEEIPAQVIGQDRELDLAVLKINGANYPYLKLGDSDKMRVGEWVVAIGQPYGLDHTVTTGVISAKGRPITIQNRQYKNLIQTDAAINPGNSGGPLLNLKGEVIAINTAVNASAQGIGFAIPTATVSKVLENLVAGKAIIRPLLGISMADINNDVRQQYRLDNNAAGILVVEVVSGSAAADAGIKPMDIIAAFDGRKTTSASELQDLVSDHAVGDKITLDILREGKQISITAVLKAKPQS